MRKNFVTFKAVAIHGLFFCNCLGAKNFFLPMNPIYKFKPAHYINGKKLKYISYSVFDEQTGKFKNFRIKLNYIPTAAARKTYAEQLCLKINEQLMRGWTPMQGAANDKLILLSDTLQRFWGKARRDVEEGLIKSDTFDDYHSQLSIFQKWLKHDYYLHNITATVIQDFLDYIYIVLKRTSTTRNNYFCTLRTFFNWCKEVGLIATPPTSGMHAIKRNPKTRCVIPSDVMAKIAKYLEEPGNEGYKLAVNLCYSCFIRPIEISKLRVRDINFKNATIVVRSDISKNKKTQSVTMPENVQEIIHQLKIWKWPQNDFLVSAENFMPGPLQLDPKRFRDKWARMRKELKIDAKYQFYSLKDSGITTLLNKGFTTIEVRDQARHSSIAITDQYTDKKNSKANQDIKNLNFGLTD